jgi:hypothetical protein
VIVLFKVLLLCVDVLSPVVLGLSVAVHVYNEDISLAKPMLTVAPLHIVAVLALVIVGLGLTVFVMVVGEPAHPFNVGVTIY